MDLGSKNAAVTDDGEGFHILLSTPDTDRDGEKLNPEEWKTPLPQHIPMSADHDMSTGGIVGSGVPALTDRGLEVRGQWADTPRAQLVRQLVRAKHLQHVSVEFIRHHGEKGGITRELIGGSFVHTPSNPRARVLSAKGIDTEATPGRAELLQAAHDAVVLLGAQCVHPAEEAAPDENDGSAEGANKAALEAAVVAKAALLRLRLS